MAIDYANHQTQILLKEVKVKENFSPATVRRMVALISIKFM